jgi:hypothetical protein
MKHYFSDGTWFDKGTEAHLIDDYRGPDVSYDAGLFRGRRKGKWDEEVCGFEEFRMEDDGYAT